jgi:hypothetical protein
MERFEIWFGGIFLVLGLLALLAFAGLYLAFARIARVRPYRWAFLGAPLIIGVVFTLIGVGFAGYGILEQQTEERLRATGTVARATVTDVERTYTRINGRYQWRARYQYQDQAGRTYQGSSTLLSPGQAQTWKPGDEAFIRYDPAAPATSIWLGREDPAG